MLANLPLQGLGNAQRKNFVHRLKLRLALSVPPLKSLVRFFLLLQKREVNRLKLDAWNDERPKMEELYFAPHACKAADVEFHDEEAVKLMAELSRHGLIDKLYFWRFDMEANDEIHANRPKLGRFVHPDNVVVVGDVDDLVEPPVGAKVYRSEEFKRVPKGFLLAYLQTDYLEKSEWVSEDDYQSTYDFDWPLTKSTECLQKYCPASVPTQYELGIVLWTGTDDFDYEVPTKLPCNLEVPPPFASKTAFQLFCHDRRASYLAEAAA
ncbi:hypothetical protein DFJ73DRAFT_767535 [Zopfochytrium polystomum]|nr:hypothetical protein DFJ73DRAFT_767535 [Zopfochytrium polystomum]